MMLLQFSIFPLDKGDHLSPYVARCLDIVDASGVPYATNAMGTILEGEYDEVMAIVRRCFDELGSDCDRIVCT